jgi:hypothetical protein
MKNGDPHVLDFSDEASAKAALDEVMAALQRALSGDPATIAGRLVVKPQDVRSAELTSPPSVGGFA